MKRSEMVKALEQEINGQLYQDYQLDTEQVSSILKKLEDMGMLPPFVDQAVITMEDYFTLHTEQTCYNGVCKWEKE